MVGQLAHAHRLLVFDKKQRAHLVHGKIGRSKSAVMMLAHVLADLKKMIQDGAFEFF